MKINKLYDQLSSKEQYLLAGRSNLLSPKFPRSLFAYENRFKIVTREIIKQISKTDKKISFLDVGCGDGVYEKLLPKNVISKMQATGIDFSAEQLKKASKYFNKTHKVDLDSEILPVPDKSVDLVICSEVLEHLFFPEKIIAEIHRVLKLNAVAIITVPNFSSMQTRLSIFLSGKSPLVNYSQNKEHIRFYSIPDIKKLLNINFEIIKVRGIGSFLFARWNSVIKLPLPAVFQDIGDRFFPRFANGLMIVVRRKQ